MADNYRSRKKGFVVFLGRGGPSRFAYLQHNWSDNEVERFMQDQSLPRDFAFEHPFKMCVLMNLFSSESWYHESNWAAMPPLNQMMMYLPHFKPSFIVLDPASSRKKRDHPKLCFPSTMWNSEKAFGKIESEERLDLEILDGEASELFKISDEDIHDLLEQSLSQLFDKNILRLGLDKSVEVDLDKYVVAVRDVHMLYLHYMDPDVMSRGRTGATNEDEETD